MPVAVEFTYIASATPLPVYKTGEQLWAFCIHTVMRTGDGTHPFSETKLPWSPGLWKQQGEKLQPPAFKALLIDENNFPLRQRATLPQHKPQADSIPLPDPKGVDAILTSEWQDKDTKLFQNLFTLPADETKTEEDEIDSKPSDPNVNDQSGSAWLAALTQHNWPVPQSLALSIFVKIPEGIESFPGENKRFVLIPDRGEISELILLTDDEGKRSIWEVKWKNDPIAFRIEHHKKVPGSLSSTFISPAEVLNLQPNTSRPWAEEFPLHYGKAMNLLDWFAAALDTELVDKTDEQYDLAKSTAYALLHAHAHSGDALGALAPELTLPVFPLKPLKEVLSTVMPSATVYSLEKWTNIVKGVVARRQPKEGETASSKKEGAVALVRDLARLADDDDALLELWASQWLGVYDKEKKKWIPTYDLEKGFDVQPLKPVASATGRRLAEHYGDQISTLVWDKATQAFNAKVDMANGSKPYDPVVAAIKDGFEQWRTYRENAKELVALPPGGWVLIELAAKQKFPWVDEMVERITGGRGKPRDKKGDNPGEYEFPPTFDIHPLLVMPPPLDLSQFRGLAVFCRIAQLGTHGDEDWRCLTIGGMKCFWENKGEKLRRVDFTTDSVTSFTANESNGIRQGYLSYRMSRIGISADGEAFQTVHRPEGEASAKDQQKKKGEDRNRRFVSVDLLQDHPWFLLPGLRFSKDLRYEFAFAAIHNSGALPSGLVRSENEVCLLPEYPKGLKVPENHRIARPYRRRVSVGPPRFQVEVVGLKAGQLPPKPASISLLADDLFSGDLTHSGPRTPAARPQVIFLHDGFDELKLQIDAPSLDRDIWRIWKLGTGLTIQDQLKLPVMTLYAAARPPAERDAPRLTLSDPAVCGMHFSLCRVFPAPADENGEDGAMFGHYQPLSFEAGDKPPEQNDLTSLVPWQRRYLNEKVTVGVPVSGNAPLLTKKDNTIEIRIPRGQVWALRIAPCISSADIERFDIYPWDLGDKTMGSSSRDSAKPAAKRVTVLDPGKGGKVVRINRAALNWRVEAALSSAELAGQMPTQVEIWNALTLARSTRSATSAGRLLAILKMPTMKAETEAALYKWCWVSGYRVEVQKWRWNGLPLGACGDWKTAAEKNGQVGMLGLLDLAAREKEDHGAVPITDYKKAEIAETPGFGDRDLSDVDPQEGKINYALPLLDLPVKEVPETEVYLEQGSAESEPTYYRVKIEISHRYRDLESAAEFSRDLARTSSAKDDDATATPWKRIILKGVGQGPVIAPRIKMILPLMDCDSSDPKARPGVVALTRETMPSPFHRLVATLELAERRNYDPLSGDLVSVDLLHEIGPDPVTSGKGFGSALIKGLRDSRLLPVADVRDPRVAAQDANEEFVATAKQKWKAAITGQAFGLTWEREANSPLFPHSGFFFDLQEFADQAGLTRDLFLKVLGHDLMAKLRFHWELDDRAIWWRRAEGVAVVTPQAVLKGPDTGPWWVRSLSRFLPDQTQVKDMPGFEKMAFTYREVEENGIKTARIGFENADSVRTTVKVRAPKYESLKKGELSSALVFVTWADILDGSSAAAARVVTDVQIVDARLPGEDPPFTRSISLMHQKPPAAISGGQFLLVHFRATPSEGSQKLRECLEGVDRHIEKGRSGKI